MRIWLFILCGAALAGCGKGSSPPGMIKPPATEAAPTHAKAIPSKAETAAVVTPAHNPPAVAAPSPARSLLTTYLETDGHGGWRKNEQAASELEKLPPEEITAAWALLRDPDAKIRHAAAVFLLPQFDPTNSDHVAAYTELLQDPDRLVRARGIDAARQFSRVDQFKSLTALALLLDVHREDRPENRAAVARLLGSLKQEAGAALPPILTALASDPDAKVRSAALAAAVSISSAAPVIEATGKALQDADATVRLAAASRLRQLGAAAAPLAQPLAAALADTDPAVAEAAAEALIRVHVAAVEPVIQALKSDRPETKKLALAVLIKIGPPAKSALQDIERCRQDADPQVRQLAETALKRLAAP